MALITLAEAKEHLRVLETWEDADIQRKVDEASWIVMDFLKKPHETWTETSAPTGVKAATKLVMSELFSGREASIADPISDAVKSLLRRQRDPALR